MRIFICFVYVIFLISIFSCSDSDDLVFDNEYQKSLNLYKNKEYTEAIHVLDRLISMNKENRNKSLGDAYFLIGIIYYMEDNSRLAFDNYIEALDIYTSLGRTELNSRILNNIGGIFYELELYEQANKYFQSALDKSDNSSRRYLAFYYYGVAKSLGNLNKYEESLENYLKALDIHESLKNFTSMSKTHIEIGILQSEVGNLELVREHYSKILEIADFTNNPDLFLWKANNNFGNAFLVTDQLDSAEKYLKLALSHQNQESELSVTYNDLGKVYNARKEYRQAWVSFKKSIEYNSYKLDINELAITSIALRNLYIDGNQPDSLLQYTMMINDLAMPAMQTKSWLQDEEKKMALLTQYQEYQMRKAEEKQHAKMSWLAAWILAFVFVSAVLSLKLYKIYNYKSPKKGHMLLKNSNELVYLLDQFKNEKDEMRKMMDQKMEKMKP